MKFTPKTEQEIAEDGLMKAGEYDFEIIEGSDEISKAGNEMIKLKLRVFDDTGSYRVIFDYLMESVMYKLHHAAEVCGLRAKYDRGELESQDFVGKSGRCKVGIRKDKNGQYPDQNQIGDYVVSKDAATAKPSPRKPVPAMADDLDDEIPF